MEDKARIAEQHGRFCSWLCDAAYPLWSTRGVDPAGGFHERLAQNGEVTATDVATGAIEGDIICIQLIRDGGRRVGTVLAGLVSFVNPSLIVIGGGLAQLGHIMLAEIRSVVYRRSLPLATGNLPLVLSELGPRAGVAGAAGGVTLHEHVKRGLARAIDFPEALVVLDAAELRGHHGDDPAGRDQATKDLDSYGIAAGCSWRNCGGLAKLQQDSHVEPLLGVK